MAGERVGEFTERAGWLQIPTDESERLDTPTITATPTDNVVIDRL